MLSFNRRRLNSNTPTQQVLHRRGFRLGDARPSGKSNASVTRGFTAKSAQTAEEHQTGLTGFSGLSCASCHLVQILVSFVPRLRRVTEGIRCELLLFFAERLSGLYSDLKHELIPMRSRPQRRLGR